jgi:hypothetical protein
MQLLQLTILWRMTHYNCCLLQRSSNSDAAYYSVTVTLIHIVISCYNSLTMYVCTYSIYYLRLAPSPRITLLSSAASIAPDPSLSKYCVCVECTHKQHSSSQCEGDGVLVSSLPVALENIRLAQ